LNIALQGVPVMTRIRPAVRRSFRRYRRFDPSRIFRKYLRVPVSHAPLFSWTVPFESVVAALGVWRESPGRRSKARDDEE
jgi:hypothetical protein